MNYSDFRKFDTANGAGVRVSLFVSGCSFACKGCFNNGAWSYSSGKAFTEETLQEVLRACDSDFIAGLSILGGEPLEPRNIDQVNHLVVQFRKKYPQKDIWVWTGYTMIELVERVLHGDEALESLLTDVDFIIDGKYDQSLPTVKPYRGSDNQVMWRRIRRYSHIEFEEVE